VKVAFRELARKHHPDKVNAGGCDDGGERFKRARKAYEILSDVATMAAFNEAARAARCRADLQRKARDSFDLHRKNAANAAIPKQSAGNARASAPDLKAPKLPAARPKLAA
jgi:DnaJ-class molecular chaperone